MNNQLRANWNSAINEFTKLARKDIAIGASVFLAGVGISQNSIPFVALNVLAIAALTYSSWGPRRAATKKVDQPTSHPTPV